MMHPSRAFRRRWGTDRWPGVYVDAMFEGAAGTEVCDLHRWPPSRQLHAKALIEVPRLLQIPNIQVNMSDFCSLRRRLILRTNFIGAKNLFEIQRKSSRPLYSISADEDETIASTGPDTFEWFRGFWGELDVDALRGIQIDRVREGFVPRGDRILQVDKPLKQSSEISLVRRVNGDM